MKTARSGTTLIETVVWLGLTVIFLTLAGQLVKQGIAIQRQGVDMEWAVSRADQALREVRRDVWNASAIAISEDEKLLLNFGAGETAEWAYTADPSTRFPGRGWLTRASNDAAKTDPPQLYEVPQPVDLAVSEGGLHLFFGDQKVWLTSQVLRSAPSTTTVSEVGRD
ncbi:MAG: hypothetical protein AAGH99_07850 [Planctomycetota bacterium]